MRSIFPALLCAFLHAIALEAVAQTSVGPGVRDIVEFTQIVQPKEQDNDALQEQVSPDGKQAFIVTRSADVASDRNRYQIQLVDIAPEHLSAGRAPGPVTVFAAAVGHDNDFNYPAIQNVRWHGDRTLVFLGRLDGESTQVYRLDVPRRELVQLTRETNLIVSYEVSDDLRRVVYAVQVPNPPLKEGVHDVVVGSQSFWSVKFGQHDLRPQRRMYQFFVADVGSSRPPRPLGASFKEGNLFVPFVSISPDGVWALLPRYEPDRLDAWERLYPLVGEAATKYARSQRVDPLRYFSTPISYVPRRMTAWRLDDGAEQSVVDAPDDALPAGGQAHSVALWQGGGESVVLAGTQLPPAPDGTVARASHVIEYWPESRRWTDIAALEGRVTELHRLRDGFVVYDGTKRREFRRRAGGGWHEASIGAGVPSSGRPAWTLRIVQGLDQPPDLYAFGPSDEKLRQTMLNPQFNPETWGAMRPYTWKDANGRQWDGGLMSGSGVDAHSRHPLLIQTYGFAPDRFYLDGPNTSDGASSAFAGRAFLREGILVLAMPWRSTGGQAEVGRQGVLAFMAGVRGAVDALVRDGRVDPAKVGIMGWSATGERVLNLVTFGDVPIRAATMADGDANTLFSLTVTYGTVDTTWGRKEELNQGLPFGDGLASWVRNDPALHTDCIHTALRIETYGPWVTNNWDIHALLRRQYKPAEMVVIPGGSHSMLTPGDRMASLQGNVDWYAFWLAGKTRNVPVTGSETTDSLVAQFARWQEMATLKLADDSRPRCIR